MVVLMLAVKVAAAQLPVAGEQDRLLALAEMAVMAAAVALVMVKAVAAAQVVMEVQLEAAAVVPVAQVLVLMVIRLMEQVDWVALHGKHIPIRF